MPQEVCQTQGTVGQEVTTARTRINLNKIEQVMIEPPNTLQLKQQIFLTN